MRGLLGVLVLLIVAAPAGAVTRYATPEGAGVACTQQAPCPLTTAINSAGAGDVVDVGTGTYGTPQAALAAMDDPATIAIRGEAMGIQRPVIHGRLTLDQPGSAARDLDLRNPGTGSALTLFGASADRVLARALNASGNDGCVVGPSSALTNAVCISRPGESSSGMTAGAPIRHVTAQGGDFGVYGPTPNPVNWQAVIAIGLTSDDVFVDTGVTLTDVAYDSIQGTPAASNGQLSTAPVFADSAAFDFRQASNSLTIDAGDLVDGAIAPTDLDLNGNLRKIGTHTDIGAYEFVPAPTGSSGAPTSVFPATAQLNGTIDPKGGRTTYHFDYGPTDSYGTSTPDQTLSATLNPSAVSTVLGALPDAATHYRLVATTDGGTVTGSDQVVPGVPSATAGDVTNITATTATLNGTVDLNDAATGDALFVYGPDLTPVQTVTADGAVSAALTGLTPDTTYQWKARIQTARGLRESAFKTFTTLPLPPTATTGDATEITQTSARLAGTVDTKGVEGQVSILLDGAPITEVTRPTGPYNFVATGLAAGSTHTYRIQVVTTGGTALGDEKTFTTSTAPSATATPSPSPTPDDEPSLTLDVGKGRTAGQLLLDRRTITLFVRCGDVACSATATGIVKKGKRTFGRLAAPREPLSLGANEQGAVRLRSSRKLRAKVRRFLNRRPKAKVIMTLSGRFEGADGAIIERSVRVRVRRLKR